jgi:hypothetical protein
MWKLMLILGALAVSQAALADDFTEGVDDGTDKSICESIKPTALTPAAVAAAQAKCLSSFNCVWDAVDIRCETNPILPGTGCASITNPVTCNSLPGCVWDASDPGGARCEPI